MVERRTETRKKLMAFTPVRDGRQGTLLGYLANLTSHGVLVIGEKSLELDARLPLEIEFPDTPPELSIRRMVIEARVARCVPDQENPREFNLGFEFLHLQEEHLQVIQSVLKRYHFRYQD